MTGPLHPQDLGIWREVAKLARSVARFEGLPLRAVEPKRRPTAGGAVGICYPAEGRVGIVVRHGRRERGTWRWAPERRPTLQILRTAAHELAHLREPGHGRAHAREEAVIWRRMRRFAAFRRLVAGDGIC